MKQRQTVVRLSREQRDDLQQELRVELKRLRLATVPPRLIEVIEDLLYGMFVEMPKRARRHRERIGQTRRAVELALELRELLVTIVTIEPTIRPDFTRPLEAELAKLVTTWSEDLQWHPPPAKHRPLDYGMIASALFIVAELDTIGVSLHVGRHTPIVGVLRRVREWARALQGRSLSANGVTGADYRFARDAVEGYQRVVADHGRDLFRPPEGHRNLSH